MDITKATNVSDIELTEIYDEDDEDINNLWNRSDANPDFNLAIIHGSNYGFQSFINNNGTGSYLIWKFYDKMMDSISNDNNRKMQNLQELFLEIQDELHIERKQLPKYFNNTTNIKFKKRGQQLTEQRYSKNLNSDSCFIDLRVFVFTDQLGACLMMS